MFRSLSNQSPTNVGTINEAEKTEDGDSRNDVRIHLPAKPRIGSWVKMHERVTIPGTARSFSSVEEVKVKIHLTVAALPRSAAS